MPKSCLLTKPWQYRHVYRHGRRLRGNGFSLIFLGNDSGRDRLGISVSGVKLAVKRNRIKRLLKEFYRHNRTFPAQVARQNGKSGGVDMIIATNKKFAPTGLADIEAIFKPYLAV